MSSISPLNKTDQIYDLLRQRLLDGHYDFGEILSAYDLAEELGVSRRPVMDAIQRLEAVGFISIVRQVGCRVMTPNERTVREHFAVAGVLEGASARLAAREGSDDDVRKILEVFHQGRMAVESGDSGAYAAANRAFHWAVLEASGNQRLVEMAERAWDLSDFYLHKRREPIDMKSAHVEHGEIANAIASREAGLARELMERHLSRFWTQVELPEPRVVNVPGRTARKRS